MSLHSPSLPDNVVTTQYMLEHLVIAGNPASVAEQILDFRDTIGDFGTLIHCGHDRAQPERARRSMQLMAERVMPEVDAAIARGR